MFDLKGRKHFMLASKIETQHSLRFQNSLRSFRRPDIEPFVPKLDRAPDYNRARPACFAKGKGTGLKAAL